MIKKRLKKTLIYVKITYLELKMVKMKQTISQEPVYFTINALHILFKKQLLWHSVRHSPICNTNIVMLDATIRIQCGT